MSRKEVNLNEVLDSVKMHFWSLVVTHHTASKPLASTILQKIKEGKSFRFLIIDPKPNKDSTQKNPEWFRDSQEKILRHDISNGPLVSRWATF